MRGGEADGRLRGVRALIQRVAWARVLVAGEVVGAIDRGLCVFVGVGHDDGSEDVDRLAERIATLRVFEDDAGKMNLALSDVAGAVLVVSQFTLMADTRRGRRPSFVAAAPPQAAERRVEELAGALGARGLEVATGRFRARMLVELANDGPVTILLDTKEPRRA